MRKIAYVVILLLSVVASATAQHDYLQDIQKQEVKEATEEEQIARGDKLKAYTLNPNTGDLLRAPIDT
ncbi:hypothetical protein, partial [Porphyromonas loveana]